MQNEVFNYLDVDNTIVNNVSKEITNVLKNTDGSIFNKVSSLNLIEDSLRKEMQKNYSQFYNEEEFNNVFSKYENDLLEYFDYKNKDERNKIKNILIHTLVVEYKKHKNIYNDIDVMSSVVLFEKRFVSHKNDILKNAKHLYKVELVNSVKNFKNALKFRKKGKTFGSFIKNLCFSISSLFVSGISLLMSYYLFVSWQFSKLIDFCRNKLEEQKNILKTEIQKAEDYNSNLHNFIKVKASSLYKMSEREIKMTEYKISFIDFIKNMLGGVNFINILLANGLEKISMFVDFALNYSNEKDNLKLVKKEEIDNKVINYNKAFKVYKTNKLEKSIFEKKTIELIKRIKENVDFKFYSYVSQKLGNNIIDFSKIKK